MVLCKYRVYKRGLLTFPVGGRFQTTGAGQQGTFHIGRKSIIPFGDRQDEIVCADDFTFKTFKITILVGWLKGCGSAGKESNRNSGKPEKSGGTGINASMPR